MRILVDEDQASRTLLSAVAEIPGLDILPTMREASDDEVWERAQRERAAILTGNAKDFVQRARHTPTHAGLLLVSRQNTPSDLTSTEIARAVRSIQELYPGGLDGVTLVVNTFVRSQP